MEIYIVSDFDQDVEQSLFDRLAPRPMLMRGSRTSPTAAVKANIKLYIYEFAIIAGVPRCCDGADMNCGERT